MNRDDVNFSPDELATLRQHGVAVFANRVIFEAQPPMPEARIAAVQALCEGPLPDALVALWRHTAGGRLDYDLSLPMNGNVEAVSFAELFHDGSDAYRDLQGWIEHEQELAEEAAAEEGRAWNGKLRYLPFGGFEYLDRVYASVEPGPDHGCIVAWKKGLPPAWTHRLHEDSVSTIAADLLGAFGALQLDADPLAPADDYFAGQSLLEYLDERREEHGLDAGLIDKLIAFYRRAVVDWRGPLAEGTLHQQPSASRAALRHAITTDDASLVSALAAAGMRFDGPFQGSALATDVAIGQGSFAAALALARAGAAVAPQALHNVDKPIPAELTRALLANGAEPDAAAIVKCAACGATASAQLVVDACRQAGLDVKAAFAVERDAMLADLKTSLQKVRAGKLGHYLGADGLAQRIEALQSFKPV